MLQIMSRSLFCTHIQALLELVIRSYKPSEVVLLLDTMNPLSILHNSAFTHIPACRAALLAVYTAEALLLAFAMKLKITAAGSSGKVAYSDTNFNAPKLLRVGNAYAEQAARFLGQCLPVSGAPVKSSLVTQVSS